MDIEGRAGRDPLLSRGVSREDHFGFVEVDLQADFSAKEVMRSDSDKVAESAEDEIICIKDMRDLKTSSPDGYGLLAL